MFMVTYLTFLFPGRLKPLKAQLSSMSRPTDFSRGILAATVIM